MNAQPGDVVVLGADPLRVLPDGSLGVVRSKLQHPHYVRVQFGGVELAPLGPHVDSWAVLYSEIAFNLGPL